MTRDRGLLRTWAVVKEDDFQILAQVMQARREEHGFLLPGEVHFSIDEESSRWW